MSMANLKQLFKLTGTQSVLVSLDEHNHLTIESNASGRSSGSPSRFSIAVKLSAPVSFLSPGAIYSIDVKAFNKAFPQAKGKVSSDAVTQLLKAIAGNLIKSSDDVGNVVFGPLAALYTPRGLSPNDPGITSLDSVRGTQMFVFTGEHRESLRFVYQQAIRGVSSLIASDGHIAYARTTTDELGGGSLPGDLIAEISKGAFDVWDLYAAKGYYTVSGKVGDAIFLYEGCNSGQAPALNFIVEARHDDLYRLELPAEPIVVACNDTPKGGESVINISILPGSVVAQGRCRCVLSGFVSGEGGIANVSVVETDVEITPWMESGLVYTMTYSRDLLSTGLLSGALVGQPESYNVHVYATIRPSLEETPRNPVELSCQPLMFTHPEEADLFLVMGRRVGAAEIAYISDSLIG